MHLIPLLFLILAQGVAAQGQATVYKSVDEHGVVTFSDTPPADATETEQMQLHTPPPSSTGEYEANLEAMRETTDRMASDRREREKHRAEMRELQAKNNAAKQQQANDLEYDNYISGYRRTTRRGSSYWPGLPPYRPGHGIKPEHPIEVLPAIPLDSRPTDGNAQLMRPMLGR